MTGDDRFFVARVWTPAALYLLVYGLLNPQLAGRFSTHFFFGGLDGYQNVWNLWWVKTSLLEYGRLPWSTTYLHHPHGTTLIGHTLNPFNGLLGLGLGPFLSPVQVYNTIVVFSFVMGGVTTFWLCRAVTGSYAGSLAGGAVFTFSSFHFMHADSHLQIVALEWIPLFVLSWIRFCEQPSVRRGLLAWLSLLLVHLCDVYFFAYCVFAGAIFYGWMALRRRDAFFLLRAPARLGLSAFLFPALATSGLLVATLVLQNIADPFLGTHSPRALAMDLLQPFVWGAFSRFRDVAEPLWRPLSGYETQSSVYVGWTAMGLAAYGWARRDRHPIPYLSFWLVLAAFFFVMALGPNLHVGGREISLGLHFDVMGRKDVNFLVLPYGMLWLAFPPWRLAGVPFLLMVMVQLAAAVMAAAGLRALLASPWRWRWAVASAWLVAFTVDILPAPQQVTAPDVPAYVRELTRLPDGAVLDLASPVPQSHWYQTIHHKPTAFGYISRTPTSVDAASQHIAALILAGEWDRVTREYAFRYVVKRADATQLLVRGLNGAALPDIDPARLVFRDGDVAIYRF